MDLAESLAGLDELLLLRRQADKLRRELGQAEARLLYAQDCRETAEGKRWARDLAPLVAEERRRLRVLFVVDSNGSPCRYRCVNACEQLRQAGVIANVSRLDSPRLLEDVPSYSTVVLLQPGWSERVERVVEAAHAAGAVVAVDLPELAFESVLASSTSFTWRGSSTGDVSLPSDLEPRNSRLGAGEARAVGETLRRADFCIGATPTIARHARLLGKPACVHPDALSRDAVRLSRVLSRLRSVALRYPMFAYVKGPGAHDGDLESIAGPLARLLAERPWTQLALCGQVRPPGRLRAFGKQVLCLPELDPCVYPWLLARCTALLAPVERLDELSNARSAVRVVEAGVFGIPAVASPTVQHREAIVDGVSGFLPSSARDWGEAFRHLCERETSLAMGAQARRVALREYSPEACRHALARRLLAFGGRAERAEPPAPLPLEPRPGLRETAKCFWQAATLARHPSRLAVERPPAEQLDSAVVTGPAADAACAWVAVSGGADGALRFSDRLAGCVLSDRHRPLAGWRMEGVRHLPCASPGTRFEAVGAAPSFVLEPSPELSGPPCMLLLEMSALTPSGSAHARLLWDEAGEGLCGTGGPCIPLIADGRARAYAVRLGDGFLPASPCPLRLEPLDRPGELLVSRAALLWEQPPAGSPDVRAWALALASDGRTLSLEGHPDPLGALGQALESLPEGGALAVFVSSSQDPPTRFDQLLCDRYRKESERSARVFDRALFERALEHACFASGARLAELLDSGRGELAAVLEKPTPLRRPVDVVVPIHGARALTRRCVESALRHATGNVRVVLLDDASGDPALAAELRDLAASDPRVVLLPSETNLGFVATANRGLRHAAGRDVLLLNSDTEVFPGFLERLAAAACADGHTGIATPFSNNATIFSLPQFGENSVPEGHTAASMAALVAASSCRLRPEMPTAVGFCMYIRAEALATVGLFDEETFGRGFGEENDFCERALEAGFKVRLCDDLFVWHKGKASFGDAGRLLSHEHEKVLQRKHPGYGPRVARFLAENPIELLQSTIRFHIPRLRVGARGSALFLVHGSPLSAATGGTGHQVRDLIRELALPRAVIGYPEGNALMAAEVLDGRVDEPILHEFSLPAAPGRFCVSHVEAEATLRRWVELFGVCWAHLHHLLFWPISAARVLREAGVPYLLSAHDYYCVSPNWNLYDFSKGAPCDCGVPDGSESGCVPAFLEAMGLPAMPRVELGRLRHEHRHAWLDALAGARMLVAPSAAALAVIGRHLDLGSTPTRVVEHGYDAPAPAAGRKAPPGRLRLGVLGDFASPVKGARRYVELVEATAKLPVEWHFFGNARAHGFDRELARAGALERVRLHGPYERSRIVDLLAGQGIDLAVMLPECDETFSFALSEALIAGLPVLACDRGAVGERVGRDGTGVVVSATAEALETLTRFAADRSALEPYRERVRGLAHRTIANNAADYMQLYASLGFAAELDAELRPEWLHELAARARQFRQGGEDD